MDHKSGEIPQVATFFIDDLDQTCFQLCAKYLGFEQLACDKGDITGKVKILLKRTDNNDFEEANLLAMYLTVNKDILQDFD